MNDLSEKALSERLNEIVVREQITEIVSFLKALDKQQRSSLIPEVKKLCKNYIQFVTVRTGSGSKMHLKATPAQKEILGIATLLCCDRKAFDKDFSIGQIDRKMLEDILVWGRPGWFSDYINSLADKEYVTFALSYDWVMELAEAGYIHPSKELIACLLPVVIFPVDDKRNAKCEPENLLKRKITLEEHLWYLFETENNVYAADRYLYFSTGYIKGSGWIDAICLYCRDGKIERNRALKECLLATARNFNKVFTGWLIDLFTKLNPSDKELLSLQQELLVALNSPHSKAVNASLKYLKQIAADKAFNFSGFLDHLPIVLASETKSVVSTGLSILEFLGKKYPALQEQLSIVACQALIHTDEALQTKAAKLINAYGNSASTSLRESIKAYLPAMLFSAKSLVAEFTEESGEHLKSPSQAPTEKQSRLSEEKKIPAVTSFEDLLFLCSQAFDGNNLYDIDVVPATLIRLKSEVRGENIDKLQPAFQRAYKILKNPWSSGIGNLDHMLATFFIDYARLLIHRFPEDSGALIKLHNRNFEEGEGLKERWDASLLYHWKTYYQEPVFEPHKQLLLTAIEKIWSQSSLPMLSCPTHAPWWIDDLEFAKRLKLYQDKSIVPDSMDLQVAISRCALENTKEALNYAEKNLKGEFLNLVRFLMAEKLDPEPAFTLKAGWMIAGITKDPHASFCAFSDFSYSKHPKSLFTGQYSWHISVHSHTYKDYQYKTGTHRDATVVHRELVLNLSEGRKDATLKDKMSRLLAFSKQEEPLIYQLYDFGESYSLPDNDISRIALLTPNNPEPLLAKIISKVTNYSSSSDEIEKRALIKTLECIMETGQGKGETGHLFLATAMLNADKTARSFAAEVWIKGVNDKTISNELLGRIIGKLESDDYAPLKRLTDLMLSNMFRISDLHNQELEKILSALLPELPDAPIKYLKNLLQIFTEVVTVNGSAIDDERVKEKLKVWKEIGGLKKVIS